MFVWSTKYTALTITEEERLNGITQVLILKAHCYIACYAPHNITYKINTTWHVILNKQMWNKT